MKTGKQKMHENGALATDCKQIVKGNKKINNKIIKIWNKIQGKNELAKNKNEMQQKIFKKIRIQ